jgi:hypothetical protein
MQIGYLRVQTLSQDEGQDVRSHAPTCPVAPAPESQLGAARVLPRIRCRQLLPPGLGQLQNRHMSHGDL